MSNAEQLIAAERARQVAKGFDAAHDDGHVQGELLAAAILILENVVPAYDAAWIEKLALHVTRKYAGDDLKMLVIGTAMLQAEIDRRLRSEEPK